MVPPGLRETTVFRTLEPLVLASASPRRREMLSALGLEFEVIPSGTAESGGEGETPETLVKRWASEKAQAVAKLRPDCWVLGADTVVLLGSTVLGKPSDREAAAAMLRLLSGRTHDVISGICLARRDRHFHQTKAVRTQVRFKELAESEIHAYVATGEPLDKAGAYGIQGLGGFLVQTVQGSYTNVVGLPLCETLQWLVEQGAIAPAGA